MATEAEAEEDSIEAGEDLAEEADGADLTEAEVDEVVLIEEEEALGGTGVAVGLEVGGVISKNSQRS